VPAQEAAQLGPGPLHRLPLGIGDDDLGVGQVPDAADVVLVEVGQDREADVGRAVAGGREPRDKRVPGPISKRARRL